MFSTSGCTCRNIEELDADEVAREHLLRAHSPTHNCRHCRKKTTKPTEDFRKEHARCRPGANTKSNPLPTLISDTQAEALQNLNQHFNKPNNEVIRCKKLLEALFPEVKFDEELFSEEALSFDTHEIPIFAVDDANHLFDFASEQSRQTQSQRKQGRLKVRPCLIDIETKESATAPDTRGSLTATERHPTGVTSSPGRTSSPCRKSCRRQPKILDGGQTQRGNLLDKANNPVQRKSGLWHRHGTITLR